MNDHWATVLGHLFLFLTTVTTFAFQWVREGRRHRWQVEQFNAVRKDVRNGHSG